MQPLRILHCLRAPVGGLFRHVRDLAHEQALHGHAVGLVCAEGVEDPLTESRLERLRPHLGLGISRLAMPREVGRLDAAAMHATRRLAQALQVDVLHGHGAKGGAYARLAAAGLRRRGLRLACFYTPHGGSLHYDPSSLKGRLFMAAERRLAIATDGLLFESAYAARAYRGNVGDFGAPARIVHNGVLEAELLPVEQEADAAELLFVGELRQLKGVDVLLHALARINRHRQCRAVIVGSGPDAGAFEALAAELGLAELVRFAGTMPAREAFRLGRRLVVPSRAESLPYVVLEAGAAGLPVIATAVGGIPEIVAGTGTPLVPAGDSATLADAIIATLAEPDLALQRANALRQTIKERFSVRHMAAAIERHYGEALDRAGLEAAAA